MDWNESYNVNVTFMDDDHAHAAQMISDMKDAHGSELQDILRDFHQHCIEHFAREEEMMKAVGFFALDCHRGEHHLVLDEMARILENLTVDSGFMTGETLHDHLAGWLLNHRNTMDYVTANFARERGYPVQSEDMACAS